jgi:polyisoprenoid-binding protein YceI
MAMALTLTIGAFAKADEPTGTKFTVNAEKSVFKWVGKKVTGEHYGNITLKGGDLTITDKGIKGIVTADMSSITCGDLDGEWGDKLVGHLKSEDFFGVEKHPTTSFEFTSVKDLGDGKGKAFGTLIIKGISKDVSFPIEMKNDRATAAIKGKVTFDRTDFNIKYGSGKFFDDLGDKTINDEVELAFTLILDKK